MTVTADSRPFWDRVRWIEPRSGEVFGITSRGQIIGAACAILGLALVFATIVLVKEKGQGILIAVAVAVPALVFIPLKAISELRALRDDLDPHGRSGPSHGAGAVGVDVVFYGPKFELGAQPLSGEPLSLREIMTGAPGTMASFLARMLMFLVIFGALVVWGTRANTTLQYAMLASVLPVLVLFIVQTNPYMGGQVSPRRIERWSWFGRTRTYTPTDAVLHVVIQPCPRYTRNKPWGMRECLARQRDSAHPLMIEVSAVPRGKGRRFTLARYMEPASPYLSQVLSLWVSAPIPSRSEFANAGAGVFTPANPIAASTGSSP